MSIQITSRQCKQARSLLKWNINDLANKSKLTPKQIERFEKSLVRFTMTENAAVVKVLEGEGITFLKNMEIKLDKTKGDTQKTGKIQEKSYEVTMEELYNLPDPLSPDDGKTKRKNPNATKKL